MAAPRAIQNAVLGVAIAVELIVLLGHPLFGWGPKPHRFIATPPTLTVAPAGPPNARSVLESLAAVAGRTADRTAPPRGRYAYVERETWQLSDQQGAVATASGPGRPLTRVISSWRAANGAGRTVTLQRTRHGGRTVVATLPGTAPLPSLSGGATTLDHRLGLTRGASTATALATFAALAAQQPIPAGAEAEILELLSGDAGLADAGTTHDRAGRAGVAIAFSTPARGATVRDTLVLSPQTGTLLEFDQTLAGGGGRARGLNVPVGALLSYTLYLRSGRVDALGVRPSPR